MLYQERRQIMYAQNFLQCGKEGARISNRLGRGEERKSNNKRKKNFVFIGRDAPPKPISNVPPLNNQEWNEKACNAMQTS
jgi:hypothetical protein